MITLEKARQIIEEGEELLRALSHLSTMLSAFEQVEGDSVQCIAFARPQGEASDFGRYGGVGVEMLPIPKAQAISAVQRQRAKVISRLGELDVFVLRSEPPAT